MWPTGKGRSPKFNGRRQPSIDGTSRMMREYQVRICERLGVKFPGPTPHSRDVSVTSALGRAFGLTPNAESENDATDGRKRHDELEATRRIDRAHIEYARRH